MNRRLKFKTLAKWGKIHYNKENLFTGGENMSLDMKYFEEMEAKIPKGKVRTRFAPSPTGYMHVGNLRTALYTDRKSTRLNSSHIATSRMPSSA